MDMDSYITAFRSAVQKIQKIRRATGVGGAELKVQDSAKKLLCERVLKLTMDIAAEARLLAGENQPVDSTHVQQALSKFLKFEALRAAISEGQRSVLLYTTGVEEFHPVDPRERRNKEDRVNREKLKEAVLRELHKLKKTFTRAGSTARIDDGTREIADALSKIGLEAMNDTVLKNRDQQVIDLPTVRESVINLLTGALLEMGLAHAENRVLESENAKNSRPPRRFRSRSRRRRSGSSSSSSGSDD